MEFTPQRRDELERAASAALEANDHRQAGVLLTDLTILYMQIGPSGKVNPWIAAAASINKAIACLRTVNDPVALARALRVKSRNLFVNDQDPQELVKEAMTLVDGADDPSAKAATLIQKSKTSILAGATKDERRTMVEEALRIYEEIGDRSGQGHALQSLAFYQSSPEQSQTLIRAAGLFTSASDFGAAAKAYEMAAMLRWGLGAGWAVKNYYRAHKAYIKDRDAKNARGVFRRIQRLRARQMGLR